MLVSAYKYRMSLTGDEVRGWMDGGGTVCLCVCVCVCVWSRVRSFKQGVRTNRQPGCFLKSSIVRSL
jgi:hypothetical protein